MKESIVYSVTWGKKTTFGVPESYMIAAMLTCLVAMMFHSRLLVGLGTIFLSWVAGLFWSHFDPHFFDIFLVKTFKLGSTKNPDGFKGNKYSA